MNHPSTRSPRITSVAAGLETTDRAAPVRDHRHQALEILIGRWINAGTTTATPVAPSVPIVASDTYAWNPGGFFVVHHAFGRIGTIPVGGTEIIGVDGDAYYSMFYDSFGNAHRSRVIIDGDEITWTGEQTRCTVTMTNNGTTQLARHEARPDGLTWTPSMDVTLHKVAT